MRNKEFAAIRPVLAGVQNPVIVELGAHRGEESKFFNRLVNANTLTHIMVEPDPENFLKLAAGANSRNVINAAAWSNHEIRTFHRAKEIDRNGDRQSGSLLVPTGHMAAFPAIVFDSDIMVQCVPLDWVFEDKALQRIDLLWVDIQGSEREMIRGGQKALAATRYLFMEVEEREMYGGQAMKSELIAMLPGWKVVGDFGFNVLMRNGKFN